MHLFGIAMVLMTTVAMLIFLYLFCYFGKLATESFSKMTDSLYEGNWQELSVDVQKYFILMIGNAQTLIFYSGFDIVVLNLGNFTSVNFELFYSYVKQRVIVFFISVDQKGFFILHDV